MIRHFKFTLAIAFCLLTTPVYAQEAQPAQQIEIIILNSRHAPVPGVQLQVTPLAGEPQSAIAPTNVQGRTTVNWLPQTVHDEAQSSDTLLRYITSFIWQVEKPGYLAESGVIGQQSMERRIQSEELASLGTMPLFPVAQKTIILHTPDELFEPGFAHSQLRQWCLEFYAKNYQLARALGTAFKWPSFAMEQDNTLTITLHYMENGWAGAAEAGILQRATLNTYLPWWLLLSENIETLPLVQNIRLIFVSARDINPLDAHAWSEDLVLSAKFPVEALNHIGQGQRLSRLAARYPLQLNAAQPVDRELPRHLEDSRELSLDMNQHDQKFPHSQDEP